MTAWPPDLGVRTVAYHTERARLLRTQARGAAIGALIFNIRSALRRLRAATGVPRVAADHFYFRRPWRR